MKNYSFDYMYDTFGDARYLIMSRIEENLKIITECSDCIYTIANTADAITVYNELSPFTHFYRVKDFVK